MAKKKNYETVSDNWNVADTYSKIKIMKLLAEIDEYIKISQTGAADLLEEFTISPQMKTKARIISLRRLHMTLRMLIDNSSFGVKNKDKKILKDWSAALSKIELQLTFDVNHDKDGNKSQRIKEEQFNVVLNILMDIHRKILTPLNDANMIYPGGQEEWEPDWTL